jgi:cytochrome P450
VKVVAGRLVEKLTELAGTGEVVDIGHWVHLASCDIIGLVGLDWDIQAVLNDDSKFTKYLDLAMRGVAYAAGKPISRIAPQFRNMRAEVKDAVIQLRKHCAIQIKEHIARKMRGDVTESCLLDEILSQSSGDQDYQIDEMLAMFLAGQETVANVLSFSICHLMRDPVILDSVDRDVQGYMANPSFEKLAGLIQLENLMKETLRHYAPVPGLRRILSKDTDIAGYFVPKGTEIVHAMKLYAHDEKIWGSDHMDFNPGRFENFTFSTSKEIGSPGLSNRTHVHNNQSRHPHAFLPFGIGPRVCMGKEMAKIEFKSLISNLLYRFKFTPIEGEIVQPMRYNSVKPMSGQRCYINLI